MFDAETQWTVVLTVTRNEKSSDSAPFQCLQGRSRVTFPLPKVVELLLEEQLGPYSWKAHTFSHNRPVHQLFTYA